MKLKGSDTNQEDQITRNIVAGNSIIVSSFLGMRIYNKVDKQVIEP